MTYLFSYGCDAQMSMSQKFSIVDAGASIVTDGGKFGAGTDALKLIDDADLNLASWNSNPTNPVADPLNPLHCSFYVKLVAAPVSRRELVTFLETATKGASLVVDVSGQLSIQLYTANAGISALVPSSSGNILGNVWKHVEIKYEVHNTTGVFKMWIDGVIERDFVGDTSNANLPAGLGINKIELHGAGNVTDTSFDDILVWDEEGTSMNTAGQLGLVRIETLIPDGDGTTNDFTAVGAGTTNADRVDEEGADDDTTYVHSSVSTNKDLYTYSDMAGAPLVIQGVALQSRMANSDIGAISMKAKVLSTATEADGTTTAVSAGGAYSQNIHFFDLDPDGDIAWTKTKVNAAEFGIEVV